MKTKLLVIFGGNSPEHEGSLFSAYNTLKIIDTTKYELLPVAVTKKGEWWTGPLDKIINKTTKYELPDFSKSRDFVKLELIIGDGKAKIRDLNGVNFEPDVILPLIHGHGAEDGSIYGLCQYALIPCIGSDILGSAVTMNKAATKSLLRDAGIAVADFLLIDTTRSDTLWSYETVSAKLGSPLFMKPVDSGSSIAVRKVSNEAEFKAAKKAILQYSHQILVESFIEGREIEVAVMGNNPPQVTAPGEVITSKEFYDHETKMYLPENLQLKIPAELNSETTQQIQQLAVKSFEVCFCVDLARIDFFLTKDNKIFVNEINAIPGFADMSLFPRLWEHQGVSRAQQIDNLVNFAKTRAKE